MIQSASQIEIGSFPRDLAAFRRRLWSALLFAVMLGLSACHNSSTPMSTVVPPPPPPSPPSPPPPPEGRVDHGLFYGSVTISADHWINAVLSADGALRIHITDGFDGAVREGSAQFVGQVEFIENEGLGYGIVIGQECAIFSSERFCEEPLAADIQITAATPSELAGEIRVPSRDGLESWPFEMTGSDWVSSQFASLEGLYRETQAEFAINDTVIISVDNAGRLFFQAPNSGCVGNGTITVNRARGISVFDAAVDFANCSGEFAALNGSYEGLVVQIPRDFYYDAELILWLSTFDDATTPTALTMWSHGF